MRNLLVVAAMLILPQMARAQEPDDPLVKQLSSVVRDPRQSMWSRIEAARSLSKLGQRAYLAVPDLTIVLNRLRGAELEPLQEAVIEALGQIGNPARAAMPTLAKASARSFDIDQAIKRSSSMILNASDAQDVESLVRLLRSRDPSQRLRAVKALGGLGPAALFAIPNLLDVLSDLDPDVRRTALAAIRQIVPDAKPTEAIVRALAADLTDPDAGVRLLAVRALARSGSAAAAASSAIEALRNDPDPDVRKAAVDALSKILGP